MTQERALRWALLALLLLGGFHLRARLSFLTPRFDPENGAAYFRAESAFQYRLAEKSARGEALPELDGDAQWPEGVRVTRELTTVMERAAGLTWRLLFPRADEADFQGFIIFWSAFVASLSIPALYLLGLRLSKDPWLSLSATAVYALSWAAMANGAGAFRLESFAWPLIHWGLACLAASLDPEEKRPHLWGAAAAFFLGSSLASWHFARFIFVTILLAAAFAWRKNKNAAMYLAGAAVFGVLVSPSLRESLFVFSPDAYSHVYGLFMAKLRFAMIKPSDPSLLSPEQRIEWTGPSNSPEAGFAIFTLFPLMLILLPRLYSRFRGEKNPPHPFSTFTNALALIYALGAVLVSRLLPPFSFFLCAASVAFSPKDKLRRFSLGALLAVALLELLKVAAPASGLNPFLRLAAAFDNDAIRPTLSLEAEKDAIDWLRANGGGDTPVLANIGLSGTFLAYANVPVLLQPKFEARGIRDKTAAFLKALYADESAFYEYCKKYEAKYFIYTTDYLLDETMDGPIYMAGVQSIAKTSPVYLFHFKPESLKRFRLVHQSGDLRIFAVEPAGKLPALKGPHPGVYTRDAYTLREDPDGSVRLDIASSLKRMDEARVHFLLARLLTRAQRYNEALAAYDASFASWPPDPAMKAERERLSRIALRPKN